MSHDNQHQAGQPDDQSDGQLGALMKDVARAIRTEAERRQHLSLLERDLPFVDQRVKEVRAARRRNRLLATGLGGALAMGAAAFVLAPRALSFQAGDRPGVIGAALAPPGPAALALRFSDGSQVTVPADARAHVEATDRRGATLAIDTGAVDVSVVHRNETHWEVRAGRYRIRVTGTRFRAAWNSEREELTLTMREGSVLVSGPGLAFPTRVVTGERLRISANEGLSLGRAAPSVAPAPPPAAPAVEPAGPSEEPAALASPPRTRAHAGWRALAARARYREALASAIDDLHGDGWAAGCGRLGVSDVVLLGDVARLAGDLARADEAYQIARRRFPRADRPTFALGLIAFEGRHDYVTAARWFEAYLRLFPRGPLARESAGRLLEARLEARDDAAARAAAQAYLRDFPDGPHAKLARRTVGP